MNFRYKHKRRRKNKKAAAKNSFIKNIFSMLSFFFSHFSLRDNKKCIYILCFFLLYNTLAGVGGEVNIQLYNTVN